MEILILTASNPYKAAGVVALDLKKALTCKSEHKVKILTRNFVIYEDESILSIHSKIEDFCKKILSLSQKLFNDSKSKLLGYSLSAKTDSNYSIQGLDLTNDYYPTERFLKKIHDFNPDAIIVLFMPYFLTFKNLYELNKATKAPILLYFMDMAPMTGGCHYAWDCIGYQNKCGKCPAFKSNKENDQSRVNWKFKNKYLANTNVKAIAATEYQYQQLQKSSLFSGIDKFKVLLSVDPNLFKPSDQTKARNKLNLPLDKRIIFFGATNLKSKRKGFSELLETLEVLSLTYVDPQEIHLVIAGLGDPGLIGNLPFSYTSLGFLNHSDLATAFQASDLFLCPSIEDSGPMMINQSIMCGTPVVAFDMGVAIDLVITGKTGYRSRLKNTVEMANGIQQIFQLNENEFRRMRKNCRNLGLRFCSPDYQANMLLNILNYI